MNPIHATILECHAVNMTCQQIAAVLGWRTDVLEKYLGNNGLRRSQLGLPARVGRLASPHSDSPNLMTDEQIAEMYAGRRYEDDPRAPRSEGVVRVTPPAPIDMPRESAC
jgi:hypothetical protein